MLDAIRKRTASVLVKLLAGLLVASFALWGINDMFVGGGRTVAVADVDGNEINGRDLMTRFRREINQRRDPRGGALDTEQARQLGLLDFTLDSMINERLIALEGRRLGLAIGDDLIRRRIAANRAFHNQAGRFDQRIYGEVLSRNGLTEDKYVASIRQGLQRAQLTGPIAAGGVVPDALVQAIYRHRAERRVAEVATVPISRFVRILEPDAVALAAFHNENKEIFTAPEYREVTGLFLDPDRLATEISTPEDQIRSEYQSQLDSMKIPERRRLKQILAKSEDQARRARDSLQQGRDFDAVAKEITKQTPESTDLGLRTRQQMPPRLAEAAFALATGEFSAPIKSAFGWHIIKVQKIEPGKTPTFAETKGRIERFLAREKAVDGLVKLANRLEDTLGGGATIEEAAGQLSLKLYKIGAVDARGRTRAGIRSNALPSAPEFLKAVFDTASGGTSILLETRDGGFVIVRVDGITPPALNPLDRVRRDVAEAWKANKRVENARNQADAIAVSVKGGASLAKLTREKGLKLVTSKPFSRFAGDPDSGVSGPLAVALFAVGTGQTAVARSREGFAIGQVSRIIKANISGPKAALANLRNELRDSISNDLLAQFSNALKGRYTVNVNRRAVDALF